MERSELLFQPDLMEPLMQHLTIVARAAIALVCRSAWAAVPRCYRLPTLITQLHPGPQNNRARTERPRARARALTGVPSVDGMLGNRNVVPFKTRHEIFAGFKFGSNVPTEKINPSKFKFLVKATLCNAFNKEPRRLIFHDDEDGGVGLHNPYPPTKTATAYVIHANNRTSGGQDMLKRMQTSGRCTALLSPEVALKDSDLQRLHVGVPFPESAYEPVEWPTEPDDHDAIASIRCDVGTETVATPIASKGTLAHNAEASGSTTLLAVTNGDIGSSSSNDGASVAVWNSEKICRGDSLIRLDFIRLTRGAPLSVDCGTHTLASRPEYTMYTSPFFIRSRLDTAPGHVVKLERQRNSAHKRPSRSKSAKAARALIASTEANVELTMDMLINTNTDDDVQTRFMDILVEQEGHGDGFF